MLVYQQNPLGVELFSHVNVSFVPINSIAAGHVSENAPQGALATVAANY